MTSTEYNLPEKDNAPWLNTTYDGFMSHEEMLSVAAQREAESKARAAVEKLYAENGDALKELAAIERQELINEALIELDAIVMGGQNTREFYLSVSHIRNVLERLK